MNKTTKILITVVVACIVTLTIAFTILKTIAYQKAITHFEEYFEQELSKKKQTIEVYVPADSSTKELLTEKAYYNALLETSKSDSLSLCLNVPDSTVSLLIKGVVVHTAKLESMRISPLFKAVNPTLLHNALMQPFKVSKQASTIPKMPLMVKIAPRDTSEYTPDVVPDTTDLDPVNFILDLKPNVLLYFYEANPTQSSDGLSQFKFDLKERTWTLTQDIKRIAKLQIPVYKPYIRVRLNKKDAKIIYRALPNQALVVIKLE